MRTWGKVLLSFSPRPSSTSLQGMQLRWVTFRREQLCRIQVITRIPRILWTPTTPSRVGVKGVGGDSPRRPPFTQRSIENEYPDGKQQHLHRCTGHGFQCESE